jgi:tripartite-type tricarboxylate transporter receptor subunit TctC
MKKLIIGLVLSTFSMFSHAWEPKEDITIVVGFPPGGSTDQIARIMADGFLKKGFKTIVQNKPGAGSVIAAKHVMNSKPNGSVLFLTGTAFMYANLVGTVDADYDVVKGLTHLQNIGFVENHIFVNSNTVAGDLQTIIEDSASGRKSYSWGATNPGAEFTIRLIQERIKNQLTVVNYTGAAQAATNLLGGHVDIIIDSGTGPLSQGQSRPNIRFVGTANPKVGDTRDTIDRVLPGIITRSWFGLSLPADTPMPVVSFYNNLMTQVMSDPVNREQLQKLGLSVTPGISLEQVIREDYNRFRHLSKKNAK